MLLHLLAIIINFIPILIAIILHEVAHGYAAYKFGDDTAKKYGRLSLNPLRHIDLFGSIIIPALLYYSGVGFVFGWAKPVPVNFNNLKNKWQEFIVAAAGIIANILLALVFAMLLRVENLISLPDGPKRTIICNPPLIEYHLKYFRLLFYLSMKYFDC